MADGPTPEPKKAPLASAAVAIAALLIAVAFLVSPIGMGGIWDPHELDAADLARRIAIHVFPAKNGVDPLVFPGASSTMPTLTDLGMGELPFTSMALGFRWLGLNEIGGRLPLALWGIAGAMVLYAWCARFVDRRAGLYAVAVLVTMPLYFLHSRTMAGDIVTMAGTTAAIAGLGGAIWDRGALARAAWLAVGLGGVASAYLTRGLLLGVAAPVLGVGFAWIAWISAGFRPKGPTAGRDALAVAVGAIAVIAGVAAAIVGLRLYFAAEATGILSRNLGFAVKLRPPVEGTFDLPLRDLGHALFPWSAFAPFALGRLFREGSEEGGLGRRRRGRPEPQMSNEERASAGRALLFVALGATFGAHALAGGRAGPIPFSAPAIVAAMCAIAIRDAEDADPRETPSRVVALGVVVTAAVLYVDITRAPDKALASFANLDPSFPKGFEDHLAMWRWPLAIFAGLVALTWLGPLGVGASSGAEPAPEEAPPLKSTIAQRAARALRSTLRFVVRWIVGAARAYAEGAAALGRVWGGNLLFVAVVIEAALVGLGAMVFLGRRFGWAAVEKIPQNFADAAVNVWWAAPLLAAVLPALYLVVAESFSGLLRVARVPRPMATVFAGVLAGGALGFGFFPTLSEQTSPKLAFEAYGEKAAAGEPLAVLGVRPRAAAYYGGPSGAATVAAFTDPGRAFSWLLDEPAPDGAAGRWLLFRAEDLPKLNALYRRQKGSNLPVIDARSKQILLASQMPAGRPNQNPLANVILDAPPSPVVPFEASFQEDLRVIGWEVTSMAGRPVNAVSTQTPYRLRVYLAVDRPVSGTWKVFVHVDGQGKRYNGDHTPLDGRYAMSLWQKGDVIVDDHVFVLEPHFTPGPYNVFWGLFSGDTRYKVTRGPAQDDRVSLGAIQVR